MPDRVFELKFPASRIPELAGRYVYDDDAGCRAAGAAARARGHYTRSELIVICDWKTSRSRALVASNRSPVVVARTRAAFRATAERLRMMELIKLNGVAVRTASVLLHFAYPDRYPILDVRALDSLGVTTKPYSIKLWLEYLEACREFAVEYGVSIRTLDKALWQHSKESSPHGPRARCD